MFRPVSGAMVGGRYRLQRVIGAGGMGEIWLAHDTELEGPCAVKFILGHLAADEGVRARLLREAKAAARLRSAHAVQVLGVGEHDGAMYLAMELLEGETLSARLARSRLLSPAETVLLLGQVTHALEKAHAAGIVHRDLKPENIWLCADHDLFVKVLDFGVAKTQLSQASKHTATGALVGTPHYMSPEQAMAEREIDHRSDLWSLAVITVECLTGKRPFEANGIAPLLLKLVSQAPPPLAQLGPHLPRALEAWWQRALQRDPERRFQSASELVEGLKRGFDAASEVASLPATKLEPLPSAVPARAPTLQAPTRGRSGSWDSVQSMSPFSRTHVTHDGGRRWRRVLLAGGALIAVAAGGWLALHGKEEAAARLAGAGGAAASAALLPQPPAPPAPTSTPLHVKHPDPSTTPTGDAPPPDKTEPRPVLNPLPPVEANPWASRSAVAGESAVRSPKVAKVASPEPAPTESAPPSREPKAPPTKAAIVKPTVAKPTVTKATTVKPPTTDPAATKPPITKPPAPTADKPPSPVDVPPAAPPRDLGF